MATKRKLESISSPAPLRRAMEPSSPIKNVEKRPKYIADLCNVSLKTLFTHIYDQTPEVKEARRKFEGSTKTRDQCKAVLKTEPETCWICGTSIDTKALPTSMLYSNCDHILPVAQGFIFLDLYSKSKGTVEDAMKIEYGWAHSICNNKKNSLVLMKEVGVDTYAPDAAKIEMLLGLLKPVIPTLNIATQKTVVFNRIKVITDYINTLPDFNVNVRGDVCPIRSTPQPRKLFGGENTMAAFLQKLGLQTQLLTAIEKMEPAIEEGLVSSLQSIKSTNPDEFSIFITNWRKLNSAIERSAGSVAGKRKTVKRKIRK
jgi:hypothetical protein